MTEQALSGLKVVEYGNFVSAAYCTKLMADLGAEVIKVEEPGWGDEARRHGPFPDDIPHPEKSGLFLYLNSNKLGITLNVKASTGQAILKQLLKQADVFVENNSPQEMAGLGLDWASLKALNPRLVMTSITIYGQTGPYRNYKGYAINAAAFGGMSIHTGEPGRAPLTPPVSQGHYQSGAMGATATFAALFVRESSGLGQHVDISEADVWATIHTGQRVHEAVFQEERTAQILTRSGYRMGGVYPNVVLHCKDGYISLVSPQGYHWKRFLDAMGNPEWSRAPRFADRRVNALEYAQELDSLVEVWLLDHTKEEVFQLCREGQIPFCPVRNMTEVVNDPQLSEREYFVDIGRPETGIYRAPGAPYKLSRTPVQLIRPAPLLGEHNEQIYCERLGYSKEELVRLRRGDII